MLSELNLKDNPFRNITPSNQNSLPIWADMADVKAKIEKSFTDCLENEAKQIVLNWGPYGGGKTFSAYYFIQQKSEIENLTQIYVRCPKNGSNSVDEFFKTIIDYLSFDQISERVRFLISTYGESNVMQFLTPKASREYAKAICLIGSEDNEQVELMNRFLYAGLTKTELKKLGLAKDIQTDLDSIKFLSGLLSCFIGNETLGKGYLVIWIDEMEDLIYYASKNYKTFSQIIRDLIDSLNDRFITFMNFTLAEGEESTIELILGGAVWSRITKKIRYRQFNTEMAINYTKILLEHSKSRKNIHRPFSDEMIKKIISIIPSNNLTPREINKYFASVINYANEKNDIEVNEAVFNDWLKEYAEEQ